MKPSASQTHPRTRVPRFLIPVLLCLTLLGWTGCRIVKNTASMPERTVSALFPGGKSAQPNPGDLQQSLMRFADAYAETSVTSADELTDVPGSPFTPRRALEFKLSSAGGIIAVATGENPYANLLDMVSVTTLTRMDLEKHWVVKTNGALYEPWLSRCQVLETNIWGIANQVLSEQQQTDLRTSIETHFLTLTNLDNLFLVHARDLLVPRTLAKRKDDKSVFDLAALNPMSGLDPAVREVTETRLFAERAIFTIQRMPWMLRWQSELLLLDTTGQPKITQALEDATRISESVDRASKAAETISQTAAALPAQIAEERKALVAALDAQEGKLTTMLQSGTEFSDSLGITITNFDALMKRFGVGAPDTNAAPPDPNARPFDILDYAKTADGVAAMAKQLNVTINELNATLDSPALDRLSSQATADARGLLNHIFLLAAGLVVLILVCALIYRVVAGRRTKP